MESKLHEAVRRRDAARMARLLRDGASPSEADWLGLTPLHCAATAGSRELAALLLAAGAECDARDEDGVSAAHLCAPRCGAAAGVA
jgi:ankyrin repeat protein